MTIFAALAAREQVTVWADTLVGLAGKPDHHRPKLAVNALAGVIGTGCGWLALNDVASEVVTSGADLDTIVPAVAAALRKATPAVVARMPEALRFRFGAGCYVVAGWSNSIGRMVVYEMAAFAFWEPRLTTSALSPRIDARLPFHAPSPGEIAALAALQAAALAKGGGSVGRLTVATITAGGITIAPPQAIAPPSARAAGRDAEPAPVSPSTGAGDASSHLSLVV